MKVCKICGKAMDDTYSICPYCGSAFAENAGNIPGEQQNENGAQPQPNPQNYAYGQNMPPYASQPPYHAQQPNNPTGYAPAPRPQRSAYIAALLAFTFGAFGLHNFYLDNKNRAILQLLVSVLASFVTFGLSAIAMHVWAVIEGLKILKGEINLDGTGARIKMSF